MEDATISKKKPIAIDSNLEDLKRKEMGSVEIIEICPVSPPQHSVAPSSLMLTHFDLYWLAMRISTERVFFYHLPNCSTSHFLSSHLPNLKHSLSLALKHFYPLAGRLSKDGNGTPCLSYTDGNSLSLFVAKSNDNLHELISNGPKNAARFRSLVPTLPDSDATGGQPIVALQATLFPEEGISIGITMLHAAMDGSSSNHFMRTWASICKSGDDTNILEEPPFYDRAVVPDPKGLRDVFLSKIKESGIHFGVLDVRGSKSEAVRATFYLTDAQLGRLRGYVASANKTRCSSFAVTMAVVWTCLLKARGRPPRETERALFAVDCRARHDPPLPRGYFGNCLGAAFVSAPGAALVSEDGFVEAAEVVAECVRGLEGGGAVDGVETILERVQELAPFEPLSVAGSPRLRIYEIDFGWGRPAKSEVVSIDTSGAMSLAENRNEEEGGLEIGLVLAPAVMDAFAFEFGKVLESCS